MKKINIVSNIVINDQDQILLIYKTTSKNYYPISGKIEINEEVGAAAKRELFEEANLKGINTHKITTSEQINEDKIVYSEWFLTTWFTGKINKDYREGEISWVDINDLDDYKMLEGDFKVITDFLTNNIKENYSFNYNVNKEDI